MLAVQCNLLNFLKRSHQFTIPIYQRTYSWTEHECRQFWADILRVGENDISPTHFIGSIVYIEKRLSQVTNQSPLLVIDGQQRLTTVTLILEALARQLGDTEPVDDFSAEKLRSYYMLNPSEKNDRYYKLILTQTDKETLLALVRQKPLPLGCSLHITNNFDFFEKEIKSLGGNFSSLCKGLQKLIVVDVALDRDHDNPQLIFESMNSTGRELSQADLIRNFILMNLDSDKQTDLYNHYWRPMEEAFGQEAYGSHFDWFMRNYLTLKAGETPRIRAVYDAFKKYATPKMKEIGVDGLVADIHTFSNYYCAIALGKESNSKLSEAFSDLREYKMDVAYPFLLELYHDYKKNILSCEVFETAVRLVESYAFRRAVCDIPTNSLSKTFATFSRELTKSNGHYIQSIEQHFLDLPSYRRFPDDDEFKRRLMARDLYNFSRRSYWLRRIENHERKERISVGEYTIEHILPQNRDLSIEWQHALGNDWQEIQKEYLHTLGNLTLTAYNAEYGDHLFREKRDMRGGFKVSPLHLNEGLAELESWNGATIQDRAKKLAERAIHVWSAPTPPPETLEEHQPNARQTTNYTINDHPFLAEESTTRSLFESLRQELLALDECVLEEFLKHYIAYKAESNFVDVTPQKNRLRLSLNMPFHELHDPRAIAKDITNLGRWGNGDIEMFYDKPEDISYILGLVRQAFEKQMRDAEIEM